MNFEHLIDNIKSRAPAPDAEDYRGDDGLLYCHKCNTPKECRIEMFGKIKTLPCICKCRQEELEKDEQEKAKIAFRKRVDSIRRDGFPEKAMWDYTFENDDLTNEKIKNAMIKYADNFKDVRKKGSGLLLYGDVGTGKTYAACQVANALIDKGYVVTVTNFAKISNYLGSTFDGKQEIYDKLSSCDLLVIDDLSAERKTDYMQEIVFNVIDTRYRRKKPVIITTNLTMDEMKDSSNLTAKRIYERILEMCFPIKFTGASKRKNNAKANYYEMKELLGYD